MPEEELVTPLQISAEPSARDLVASGGWGWRGGSSPNRVVAEAASLLGARRLSAVYLDPATPRDPQHQRAEIEMTTGQTAGLLRHHLDAVVKVGQAAPIMYRTLT